ncbi:MAG: hypothetical protein B7C24_05125 [Bacteroidetes bacterium 4572_77]|nr:MAG: hypothetical protein B7C24_05125 [Bacteroidetes bacterium 4572_77]
MKKIFLIVLTALLLSSCNKDNDLQNNTYMVVVESYLEPNHQAWVRLSNLVTFASEEDVEAMPIDNLNLYIIYNETDFLLIPLEDKPGEYVSIEESLPILTNATYHLRFMYDDMEVSASTVIPEQPVNMHLSATNYYVDPNAGMGSGSVEPLTVTWSNPDNAYYQIVIEYLEDTYDPIRDNMLEDTFDDFRVVSSDPVNNDAYDFNTRNELLFFGSYRLTLYKVNNEYVDLYENISQSSLSLSEPATNVQNGLGVFTGVNSVSVLFNIIEI